MATVWLLLSQWQAFESKMALKQLSEVEEIASLGNTLSFEETLNRDRGRPEPEVRENLLILETSLLCQVTFVLGSWGKRALCTERLTWCHTYKPGCCTGSLRHWKKKGTSSTLFISSRVKWPHSSLPFLEKVKLGLIPPLADGIWSTYWLYIFLSIYRILSICVLLHSISVGSLNTHPDLSYTEGSVSSLSSSAHTKSDV